MAAIGAWKSKRGLAVSRASRGCLARLVVEPWREVAARPTNFSWAYSCLVWINIRMSLSASFQIVKSLRRRVSAWYIRPSRFDESRQSGFRGMFSPRGCNTIFGHAGLIRVDRSSIFRINSVGRGLLFFLCSAAFPRLGSGLLPCLGFPVCG